MALTAVNQALGSFNVLPTSIQFSIPLVSGDVSSLFFLAAASPAFFSFLNRSTAILRSRGVK